MRPVTDGVWQLGGFPPNAINAYILGDVLKTRGYDPKLAPVYGQMLVGMVASAGQWWLDARKPPLEEMAAHLVTLAWNGLRELDPKPKLSAETIALLAQDS